MGFVWNGWRPPPRLQGKQPCCSWQPYKITLSRGLWVWELRIANVASVCTAWDKMWAAAFLISHLCKLLFGGAGSGVWPSTLCLWIPLCAVGGAPVSAKDFCPVLAWQTILGSPSVINIHLETAPPQDSPFWQCFQCSIVYSFLYQLELLGPLSY